MKKILFYSTSLNNYLKCHKWEYSVINDFFDIEAQKMLPQLGIAYKTNPIFVYEKHFTNSQRAISFYNIDSIISSIKESNILGGEILGVVYECYSSF